MPNGMTNKSIDMDMLAYFLGGAGAEIAGPGTLAAGLGPPVQQVARQRNIVRWLRSFLVLKKESSLQMVSPLVLKLLCLL